MYGVINQEAIIMCIQRRRLIKFNASLSGISRTRRSEMFSSLRRIRVIIDYQDAPIRWLIALWLRR